MDFSKAKRKNSKYLTGEIESDELQSHISDFIECSEYQAKLLKIDEIIKESFKEKELPNNNFKKIVMDEIMHKKSPKKSYLRIYAKQSVAACIICIIAIGLFMPWNGKSLAAGIEEWMKRLSFTEKGVSYEINTERARKSSHSYWYSIGDELIAEERNRYKTIEDARKNIPEKLVLPEYMPEGFDKPYIIYYYKNGYINRDKDLGPATHGTIELKYVGKAIENVVIKDGEGNILNPSASFNNTINIRYKVLEFPKDKFELLLNRKTAVKKVKIGEYYGVVFLEDDGNNTWNLYLALPNFEIGINLVSHKWYDSEFDKKAEEELVKIAESILKQFDIEGIK